MGNKISNLSFKLKKERKLKEKYEKEVSKYRAKLESNEEFLKRTEKIILQYQTEIDEIYMINKERQQKRQKECNLIFSIVDALPHGISFLELIKIADDDYGIVLDDAMHYINEFIRIGRFKISKDNKIIINPKYQ